ncbi:hypothetical protein H9P43_009028 [Blastocladiella emersonii ATCC 22665]|nr:hypothetical protein H9P43_009028 [Blastocladiella emersonii ATCC 22665]
MDSPDWVQQFAAALVAAGMTFPHDHDRDDHDHHHHHHPHIEEEDEEEEDSDGYYTEESDGDGHDHDDDDDDDEDDEEEDSDDYETDDDDDDYGHACTGACQGCGKLSAESFAALMMEVANVIQFQRKVEPVDALRRMPRYREIFESSQIVRMSIQVGAEDVAISLLDEPRMRADIDENGLDLLDLAEERGMDDLAAHLRARPGIAAQLPGAVKDTVHSRDLAKRIARQGKKYVPRVSDVVTALEAGRADLVRTIMTTPGFDIDDEDCRAFMDVLSDTMRAYPECLRALLLHPDFSPTANDDHERMPFVMCMAQRDEALAVYLADDRCPVLPILSSALLTAHPTTLLRYLRENLTPKPRVLPVAERPKPLKDVRAKKPSPASASAKRAARKLPGGPPPYAMLANAPLEVLDRLQRFLDLPSIARVRRTCRLLADFAANYTAQDHLEALLHAETLKHPATDLPKLRALLEHPWTTGGCTMQYKALVTAAKHHDADLVAQFVGSTDVEPQWPLPSTDTRRGRHLRYVLLWALVEAVWAIKVPVGQGARYQITKACKATIKLLVEHPACEWWQAVHLAPLGSLLILLDCIAPTVPATPSPMTLALAPGPRFILDTIQRRTDAIEAAIAEKRADAYHVTWAIDVALRMRRPETVTLLLDKARKVPRLGVKFVAGSTPFLNDSVGSSGSVAALDALVAGRSPFKTWIHAATSFKSPLAAALRDGNTDLVRVLFRRTPEAERHELFHSALSLLLHERVEQDDLRIPLAEFERKSLAMVETLDALHAEFFNGASLADKNASDHCADLGNELLSYAGKTGRRDIAAWYRNKCPPETLDFGLGYKIPIISRAEAGAGFFF